MEKAIKKVKVCGVMPKAKAWNHSPPCCYDLTLWLTMTGSWVGNNNPHAPGITLRERETRFFWVCSLVSCWKPSMIELKAYKTIAQFPFIFFPQGHILPQGKLGVFLWQDQVVAVKHNNACEAGCSCCLQWLVRKEATIDLQTMHMYKQPRQAPFVRWQTHRLEPFSCHQDQGSKSQCSTSASQGAPWKCFKGTGCHRKKKKKNGRIGCTLGRFPPWSGF